MCPPILAPSREHIIEAKQLAAAAAWLADQKKAQDVRVYDVSGTLNVTDYFVVVTGLNRPHVKALHEELHVRLKAAGERYSRAEGGESGWWVLLDYVDVVVHVLQPEARKYYDIDRIYQDCTELDWRAVKLPELPQPASQLTAS